MKRTRVLIVDDEPLSRDRIRLLLADRPDTEIVGESADGAAALRDITHLRPDLVFLDVQMPELNGFDVVERLETDRMPAIVFVTAYDAYAVRAFEVNALDYLLKPIDPAKLNRAIERFRTENPHDAAERVLAALESVTRNTYRSRIVVRDQKGAFFLAVASIDSVEAQGNYVRIHAQQKSYLLRATLSELAETLDPDRFVRVNRSVIVNLDAVERIEPWARGEFSITLRNGQKLTSSRAHGASFRELMQ
jgi:two-component system LytT family response regulator